MEETWCVQEIGTKMFIKSWFKRTFGSNPSAMSSMRTVSDTGPVFRGSMTTPFRGAMTTGLYTLPQFEDVIVGEATNEPWTAREFLQFLRLEKNEENLLFVSEIEAYKVCKGRAKKSPPDTLLYFNATVRQNEPALVEGIIDIFVKENAPMQVNISDEQRTGILASYTESKSADPELFEEAQSEVKRLMYHDAWPRFVKRLMTQNISIEDRQFRFVYGMASLVFYLIAFGLMLGLRVPRWYLFLLCLPLSLFYSNMFTVQTKLCISNAMNNRRDVEGSINARVLVQCPIVKRATRRKAKIGLVIVIGLTLLTTGASFAVTYAIEAGQGMVLYY